MLVYRLEEDIPGLGWSKGDIISQASLDAIMTVYYEIAVTVILVQ